MIIQGDCLEIMRSYPDNHFSCICTDPPYGLSFMSKGWDHAVPGKEYWKECKRVLKPGGFLLAMGGTRTFHRLTCAIEDAGLEIRDCLMWLYGSGFPKSHNHFGIEGYGTALKPAWEPIIMAMKPCEGTFKQNAEKWGQAGINIDACRIPTEDKAWMRDRRMDASPRTKNDYGLYAKNLGLGNEKGRWPANLILDEEAAHMLDEQTGILKSGGGDKGNKTQDGGYGKKYGYKEQICEPSSDGASRFFYVAKASPSERGENNKHPTVKPLSLMEYLIKLIMPPKDGILLDPFAGSGTTILGANRLGYQAIGIEKEAEYCEIAKARLQSYHSPTTI